MHIVEGWGFKNLDFVEQRNEKSHNIFLYGIAMEYVLKQYQYCDFWSISYSVPILFMLN